LSTKLEKKLEKILKLLERLTKESTKGTPIIVEGRNDINTLHKLGVEGDIISAKSSGRSFLDVLSEIEKRGKREVILLMDFDRHGKEWTNRLTRRLEEMKIKPNLLFWKSLLSLVGHDVKDIEGLATYLETLKKKVGA
jgi:2,5-diamino-6-(ribosylamino)-4(3H)-pyrimidinone 5'-phosphate reductase